MNDVQVDLLFRNAHLEDSLSPVDIAIKDGAIMAIEAGYPGQGIREIDASGLMVSTLFIDPHHHLDCAYLHEPINHSGTLAEAIRINAGIKAERSYQEIYQKACLALEQALLNGTGWIRNHGDVDSISKLELMYPVLEAKEKFRDLVDVQFVTFPQLGLVRDPETIPYMRAAMREGADVVGGMPHHEASMEDAARHIDICFEIAKEFSADIDMHIDETDDPASRTLEILAEATIREGYQGRVTAGHCCALAAYEDDYAKRVIDRVAEAQINVVTNPLINLYLQGRGDAQPVRRGITRVKELLAAGVNVTCGLDDVRNIFFPYGRMDMLEVAMITSITAHLTTPEQIQASFDMPRQRAAQTLRLDDYRLAAGAPANVLFFPAENAQEALRLQPLRRYVVRHGRIVASNEVYSSLFLN
jgi:cytosine deaminase